jgi:uncharacterized protein (DUF885 family)
VSAADTQAPDPNAAVNALADRFWERVIELDPIWATILGDDRYDDRLPDLGPDGRAAEAALAREVIEAAEAIDPGRLTTEQVVTRDMLLLVAHNSLDGLDAKLYQLAVDHIWGVQTLPIRIAQYQPADTPERLERLLTRFAAYPALVDQHIDTLREGLADGRTSAAIPVRRAIEQIARMLETPVEQAPAVLVAQVADDPSRERVLDAIATHHYPALQTLHDFLTGVYEPHARALPGIGSTPGGAETYRLSIRLQTSVGLTAEDVHAFGLEDLDRIEEEKDTIARSLGHRDRFALDAALAGDPSNHTDDPLAIIRLAEEQTARAYAAAPRYFGRLPRADCLVVPVEGYRERESPPAFYMPPTIDGSRQGQYYLNTYQPRERLLHKIAAITFHEATPGHHFQIGIEMELDELPAFRRLGSRMAGVAFSEGWGLYAERLADEMGLYASEQERVGMLDTQAFRASRLVVDSGIHAFGWDRDRAIRFMHERGALPMVDAEIEVDRYTIWPGQALADKVGQREIERARAEVSDRMGEQFDVRAFHDEVLAHGSLPLATLRREIPAWVDASVARR